MVDVREESVSGFMRPRDRTFAVVTQIPEPRSSCIPVISVLSTRFGQSMSSHAWERNIRD